MYINLSNVIWSVWGCQHGVTTCKRRSLVKDFYPKLAHFLPR